MNVTVRLTDSERWDASEREWEDMLLKLEVKVKEKIVQLEEFCTAEGWCDSLSVI